VHPLRRLQQLRGGTGDDHIRVPHHLPHAADLNDLLLLQNCLHAQEKGNTGLARRPLKLPRGLTLDPRR